MMKSDLAQALTEFCQTNTFKGKGPLSVALIVTQHAYKMGLPLNPDHLLTGKGGQVVGLGGAAVQKVLAKHGVMRVLAREGGRTSRGSIDNMRSYVRFLNDLHEQGLLTPAKLDDVETFWIERVKHFFAQMPFRIKLDASKGLRALVGEVLAQAEQRQKESSGTWFPGIVMQHLVGAKLDLTLGKERIEHHSASAADQQSGRSGDFTLASVVIHVTTAPGEAIIERCRANLEGGLQPIVITTQKGVAVTEGLVDNAGLTGRIDVFEIEQFIALNLYESSRFESTKRRTTVAALVEKYNTLIDKVETDPSLKIELS